MSVGFSSYFNVSQNSNPFGSSSSFSAGFSSYSTSGGSFMGRSTSTMDELSMFGGFGDMSFMGGNMMSMGTNMALMGTPFAGLGLLNMLTGGKLFESLGLNKLLGGISEMFGGILGGAGKLLGGIGKAVGGVLGGVGKAIGGIGKGIGKALKKL